MNTYIALLRGINVSGHNKIKMVDLQKLFIHMGHSNVLTYIQSGNVIFSSEEINISTLEQTIIHEIEKQFSYVIKVLVLKKILEKRGVIQNTSSVIDVAMLQ